jgi:hypothetical protein
MHNMVEQGFNPQALQVRALQVVDGLQSARDAYRRDLIRARNEGTEAPSRFSPDIQAVFVFSGPGNYFEPLKPGQTPWTRWMDHDRIRAGVAMMSEVTAARMRRDGIEVERTHPVTGEVRVGVPRVGGQVTKADIAQYGPKFVYNGVPSTSQDFLSENEALRLAMVSRSSKLPVKNVVIMDEVTDASGTHAIRHTADQVNSFYRAVRDPDSDLYRVTNVALVAQDPDFIRNPFYTAFYDREHVKLGFDPINYWAYPIRSRVHAEIPHTVSELPRLVEYAQRGHLSTEPSALVNIPLNIPAEIPIPRARHI